MPAGRASWGRAGRSTPLRPYAVTAIQPKLVVDTPGDAWEREADRVAEQVLRGPETGPGPVCACGGGCPRCRQAPAAHASLRTERIRPFAAGSTVAPPLAGEALRSPGQPLATAVRQRLELRFGRDFHRVRVHTGPQAANAARALGARAYTLGDDIVFGASEYAPGTAEGMRLLAHELTHVVQQAGGVAGPGSTGSAGASSGLIQRFAGPPPPGSDRVAAELARRALQGPVVRAGWRHFWRAVVRRFALRGAIAATLTASDGPFPFGDLAALGLTLWTIWEIVQLWDALWREAQVEAARRPETPPETALPPRPQPQPEPEARPDAPPEAGRREPRAERCPLPVNELTEFVRWGSRADASRAAGGWKQELIGDRLTDWTGCEVFESGPVRDECWVEGSPCRRETVIDPAGHWICSGNEWGLDWVGTGEDCVNYYQQHSRLPCRITADQTMHMVTDRGPRPYKQNELYIEIHPDKVVSSRDDETEERPWPPP